MILVTSSPSDVHAQEVLKKLAEQGTPCRLLDLSLFPVQMSLTGRYPRGGMGIASDPRFELQFPQGDTLDLAAVRAVWWRRPQPYRVSPEISDAAMRDFALSETETALTGIWQATTCLWVNDPINNSAAAHKPWQLATARAVGLTIPETLITNDPEEARSFWAAHSGNVVYKPFRQTHSAWRETRALLAEDVFLIEAVRLAPVLFQELIKGVADLRVTVIGDELFAAAAALEDATYNLDIRFNPGIAYKPHTLPDNVAASVFQLMQSLGLEYGAIDMRLTPDDEYVFFEVNPAGQFLYVERSSRQPITAALVAHLARGQPSRGRRPRGMHDVDDSGMESREVNAPRLRG
jgi:glutathione synthase/RimK-type ligase-like ATP-grasp enzyme